MNINSWTFLVLCILGILLFRNVAKASLRLIPLLLLSLYFVVSQFPNSNSAIGLSLFLIFTYVIAVLFQKYSLQHKQWLIFTIFGAYFLFLLGVRDTALLPYINPFSHLTQPIVLIGISYMVFRGLSYLMEIELIERPSFLNYLNYMLFFPSLLAGPIARYRDFNNTLMTPNKIDFEADLRSLHRIANGCIKKYLIADNLAIFIQVPLDVPSIHMFWMAALLKLVFIYMDFSGYCDIAIGVAQLMGIHLPENFNAPFKATNIQDFWSRWHISLTIFIKDYIFTPISKIVITQFPIRLHFYFIALTYVFCMILIAFWHGISWGYLIFGVAHAVALVLVQVGKRFKFPKWPPLVANVFVYCFVSVTLWIGALPNEKIFTVIPVLLGR